MSEQETYVHVPHRSHEKHILAMNNLPPAKVIIILVGWLKVVIICVSLLEKGRGYSFQMITYESTYRKDAQLIID